MSCELEGYQAIEENLAPTGSVQSFFAPICNDKIAKHEFLAIGTNSKNETYCNKVTLNWYLPIFYGVIQNEIPSSQQILTMTKVLKPATWKAGTWSFVGAGYKVFVIPKAYPVPITIKEKETGFGLAVADVEQGYSDGSGEYYNYRETAIINTFGVLIEYRIYRSTNYLNDNKNFLIT